MLKPLPSICLFKSHSRKSCAYGLYQSPTFASGQCSKDTKIRTWIFHGRAKNGWCLGCLCTIFLMVQMAPFGRLEVAMERPPYFQSKTQLNPRKLRCHLKRDHFKRKKHLPTINFQGMFVSFQGWGTKQWHFFHAMLDCWRSRCFFWNMPSDALVSSKIPWDLKMTWGLCQMAPEPQWRSTSFRQQKNWHSCFQR